MESKETRSKKSISKMGAKNPMWLGDKVGYAGVHNWIRRNYKKPEMCQICHNKKALDMANISGEYKRDINDWEFLCRRCHMIKDGRIKNLVVMGCDNASKMKLGDKWSLKYDHCKICNKKNSRHAARGICCRCYRNNR